MSKLIDIKKLSEELGETERTLRNWIAARRIPVLKIGPRTMRFDLQRVREAIERFEIGQAA